jgi:hypothetical protein
MKKKLIKGLHINSRTQSVSLVEVGQSNIKDIHTALECEVFTTISLQGNEAMFVDDESLLHPDLMFGGFLINEWQIVVVGNGLILDCDRNGNSISTKMRSSDLPEITWLTPTQCKIYASMVFSRPPQIYPID